MQKPSRMMTIAIVGVAAIVGFLALDGLVLSPLAEVFDRLDIEEQRLEAELAEARALIQNEKRIRKRWSAYAAAGLDGDTEIARIRVQEQLTQWSQSAGLNVERLSSERVAPGERFDEVGFIISGTGSMASVQKFLFSLRRAPFALRIKECDITSRNEKQDRLTVSLRLSTIVVAERGEPPRVALAPRGRAR